MKSQLLRELNVWPVRLKLKEYLDYIETDPPILEVVKRIKRTSIPIGQPELPFELGIYILSDTLPLSQNLELSRAYFYDTPENNC